MEPNKQEEEINKAIIEWMINKNYSSAIEPFLTETGIPRESASKDSNLKRKWGMIMRLHQQVKDLETTVKQLKEELIKSGTGGNGAVHKVNESMVVFLVIIRVCLKHPAYHHSEVIEAQLPF